ncbi:Notch1p [Cichlidogyrus casuarinus]|uniref:Notch1p n=1 Tax=Cichlidogyrus casuarinus TaxID=1844966 RepID=A0ABD2PR95_9PLAT
MTPCECPPAWTGYLCEKPYDPCSSPENDRICNLNRCRREPKSKLFGFICECMPGLESSEVNPACVDMDECALISGLCRNGGTCVNLKPTLNFYTMAMSAGYKCECLPGFWGENCEKVDKENAGWSNWSEWSDCSLSCGIGTKERHRTCILRNQDLCSGSNFDRQYCVGQRISCDQASTNELGETVYQQGDMIVKEWVYEYEAFSDPWTWSEQQSFQQPSHSDNALHTYNLIFRIIIRTSDFLQLCQLPFLYYHFHVHELLAIFAGIPAGLLSFLGLRYLFRLVFKRSVEMRSRQSYVVSGHSTSTTA